MKRSLHPLMLKSLSSIVISLLLAFNAYSQASFLPGYVLTNNNDTLKGYVDFRNNDKNSKICSFKAGESSQIITFSPGEIKEYRFNDGKYFVSKEVKNKELFFLEYMVNGITDLYYYWNNGPHYLIEKNNGEIYELTNEEKLVVIDGKEHLHKTNYYTGLLKVIFQDCPQVFPIIEKTHLENQSLINVTRKYHEYVCDDDKCIIYENKLPFLRIKVAPVISAGNTFFSTSNNEKFPDKYEPSLSPSAGLVLKFTFPRWNEKFALLFGNEFGLNKFKKHDELLILNTPSVRDASIDATRLQTTLAIKYIIPRGKWNPTFQIGYSNNLFLKWDAKSHAEATYNGRTTVYDYTEGPFTNNLKGVSAGAGFEFRIKGKKTGFIDLLFKHNSGRYAAKGQSYLIYTDNTLMSLGLSGGIYF